MTEKNDRNTKVSSSSDRPRPVIVGVGASAGGVEALEELFVAMPDKLGMAFVVVQHLSGEFESLMPQILARKTNMLVVPIEDQTIVEPNVVYVLPGGKDVFIESNRLLVADRQIAAGSHRPIDAFFRSLALDVGDRSVGIILSGTGSDGSIGVQQIHQSGGLVVVQSEESARFNGMPRNAIDTGIADSVAAIEDIPDVLIRFSDLFRQSPDVSRSKVFARTMSAEKRILHLLNGQFGINFELYKSAMVSRRIGRRILLNQKPDIESYLDFLEDNDDELNQLFQDMLIGVTSFFRDSDAFEKLEDQLDANVINAVSSDNTVRVWITPCATGEEAYSIAILIDELLKKRNQKAEVKVFATDVSKECIDTASKGWYPKSAMVDMEAERLATYFEETDDGYRIRSEIRKQVVFAAHNILHDSPFTKLDLVCCRNLLIYLKANSQQKVLSLLNFSLNEGGILFLGPSESTGDYSAEFRALDDRWRIFQKIQTIRMSSVRLGRSTLLASHRDASTAQEAIPQQTGLLPVYDKLLSKFMPPAILVNKENHIVHIFGKARRYLEFPEGRHSNDFLSLLPATLRTVVGSGLKRCRSELQQIAYPNVHFESEDDSGCVSVVVEAVETKPSHMLCLVSIHEKHESIEEGGQGALRTEIKEFERIHALEQELSDTRESLQSSVLDLKTANEEFQATNEELIASNEELQSTNEELHSVNEELYTVNAEHQRKITELTELTDDMENLLDSIRVDTIFLDRSLRVRKFTLGIAKTFRLVPQDVGRHFDSFNHDLLHENIVGLVESVLKREKAHEEEVQDKSQNWYLMRLLPYSSRGTVDGVLLTLIDITELKQVEQRLSELSEIVESSDDAIFRVSNDGTIRTWNHGAAKLFLHQPENVIGKHVEMLSLDGEGSDLISAALEKINAGTAVDHVELKAARRNSEEFDVQSTISPIYSSTGTTLEGASIILRDISAHKAAQEHIREEVQRRDHFLAVLSHELRNPTAAITNAISLMRRENIGREKRIQAQDVIYRQSQQLSKMLDDLLHVSRVTHDKVSLDLKPVNLVATAKQVVECIEEKIDEKQQVLYLELPNEPVFTLIDETRIIQAQTNLLVNATKYTPENGHISYAIFIENGFAVIEVRDDGEGISQELLPQIFDVFVQADQPLDRSKGGMGLGLPLVKMIATLHGGTIAAESNGSGQGSVFTMKLPLQDIANEVVEEHRLGASENQTLSGKKLLLIEDNDGNRQMLADYLELDGFQVRVAANGLDGLVVFDDFLPDICIVDIGLPDLDGFEVAKQICTRTARPELLVALTGYGQEKDRERVFAAGFDLHLVKPVEPDELVERLTRGIGNLEHGKVSSRH